MSDFGDDPFWDQANGAPPPVEPPPEYNLVEKGDYYDLMKKVPSLRQITVGIGWDHKMFEEKRVDVDLSCFLLNKTNQTRDDEDFVFYNNESACNGAVRHHGDNRTGAGDGDDESMNIDLNGVPFDVIRIMLTISIYNAKEMEQHMGMVRNIYMRVVNDGDGMEIIRLKMDEAMLNGVIAMQVGCLVREGPKWFFEVLETPVPAGLASIATSYGIVIGAGA